MDKNEYRIKSEEIKELAARKKYVEAVEIADTIDWRRVKSVMMLMVVSEIYKKCRLYDECKEILHLAYERNPESRSTLYSLCELAIKMEEIVQATEYYKEFVQAAPKDTGRYILQYKLYELQEVSLEERISVLEELKRKDYREKWGYELAFLYHRIGLGTRCVEECDELILWFGSGRFVLKAMELKMLHAPLTQEQEEKYRTGGKRKPIQLYMDEAPEEMNIKIKPVDVGQYNTINLQQELAASMQELMNEEDVKNAILAPLLQETVEVSIADMDQIQHSVPYENAGEYSGEIQYQEEEVSQEENPNSLDDDGYMMEEYSEETYLPEDYEDEIYPEETYQTEGDEDVYATENDSEETYLTEGYSEDTYPAEDYSKEVYTTESYMQDTYSTETYGQDAYPEEEYLLGDKIEDEIRNNTYVEKESEFSQILNQEYDGQISLVMPKYEPLEKQITGQLEIGEVLAEWERMKRKSEYECQENLRLRVLEQTSDMFSEFDATTKQDLLNDLSKLAGNYVEETEEEFEQGLYDEIEEVEFNQEIDATVETELDQEIYETDDDDLELEAYESEEVELDQEIVDIKEEQLEQASNEPEEMEELEELEELAFDQEIYKTGEIILAEAEAVKIKKEEQTPQTEKLYSDRELTKEEEDIFANFIHNADTKKQISNALENISIAAYTGNIIVTGDKGSGTIRLAKKLIKEVQQTDKNFSGKVAKVTGESLNSKNIASVFSKLANGALIIEKAGGLFNKTIQSIEGAIEQENNGIIIVLEGTKKEIDNLLKNHNKLNDNFNARVDIKEMKNDALVCYGREYALEKEYVIDELGILALYTRISDIQTSDHIANSNDVEEIVDESIHNANRKNLSHFMQLLLGNRYDQEDMIVIRENHFLDY